MKEKKSTEAQIRASKTYIEKNKITGIFVQCSKEEKILLHEYKKNAGLQWVDILKAGMK